MSRNERTPEGWAVASGAGDHLGKGSAFASEDTLPAPAGRGLSLDEQETTITVVRAEGVVHVWSCWPAHVRALRADDRFLEVGSDEVGAWFEISIDDWHPVRGARRRRTTSGGSSNGVPRGVSSVHPIDRGFPEGGDESGAQIAFLTGVSSGGGSW